jgi:hypothetical protein
LWLSSAFLLSTFLRASSRLAAAGAGATAAVAASAVTVAAVAVTNSVSKNVRWQWRTEHQCKHAKISGYNLSVHILNGDTYEEIRSALMGGSRTPHSASIFAFFNVFGREITSHLWLR